MNEIDKIFEKNAAEINAAKIAKKARQEKAQKAKEVREERDRKIVEEIEASIVKVQGTVSKLLARKSKLSEFILRIIQSGRCINLSRPDWIPVGKKRKLDFLEHPGESQKVNNVEINYSLVTVCEVRSLGREATETSFGESFIVGLEIPSGFLWDKPAVKKSSVLCGKISYTGGVAGFSGGHRIPSREFLKKLQVLETPEGFIREITKEHPNLF